jgi:hypothetical protein
MFLRHELGGSLLRGLRAFFVDFLRPFRRISQDRDVRWANFHETAADGDEFIFLALSVESQLSESEGGYQGGMVRQDA